ncbi:MAG: hypothetical protein EHM72_17690 [Calditrichaeota bacterium]|nr:MAG: hypothetical protein EHM72_17690 [Calditrichota bacterium]
MQLNPPVSRRMSFAGHVLSVVIPLMSIAGRGKSEVGHEMSAVGCERFMGSLERPIARHEIFIVNLEMSAVGSEMRVVSCETLIVSRGMSDARCEIVVVLCEAFLVPFYNRVDLCRGF